MSLGYASAMVEGAIRYLSADDVDACLPSLDERLALAEEALVALARGDAEMPPKIGIHPRPEAFVHAMPAYLRGRDLVGIKWVAGGYPGNAALGLPAINALIVLNDPATGAPTAILDGGRITAVRTAAVSGMAIRRFAPRGASRVALVGAGVQGNSHLPVVVGLLPGAELRIYDRHPERADALAQRARTLAGVGPVHTAADARAAVEGADVVVTMAAFGPVRQVMTEEWLTPEALVVPVDFATYLAADVARNAALFLVDDEPQFRYYRELGEFDGYPDPAETLGEAIQRGASREQRPAGRVVSTALGVGLADVVFGDAVVRRAIADGRGQRLPR
jgi:ornithine cyclodeaminase/alanine dehydrogenase-like protein (mu-crystallin family)